MLMHLREKEEEVQVCATPDKVSAFCGLSMQHRREHPSSSKQF